ncbi:MAG: hypothetical protein ABTQ32_05770 [Myxococcaceae bacterium]
MEARRQLDVMLADALVTTSTGVLVLVEPLVPVSMLPAGFLEALGTQVSPPAALHVVSDELLALVCPSASLFDGWSLVDSLRQQFGEHHIMVNVGLSSWPMHGPTMTDVFAAAVAGLVDDRCSLKADEPDEERHVDIEGDTHAWSMAGEFLSA